MLDARLNLARVEQRHAELCRSAACRRSVGAENDAAGHCAEPVLARALRLRRRRSSLRLRFVAAFWRG